MGIQQRQSASASGGFDEDGEWSESPTAATVELTSAEASVLIEAIQAFKSEYSGVAPDEVIATAICITDRLRAVGGHPLGYT